MDLLVVSTLSGATWGGSEVLWGEAAARLRGAGHAVTAVTHRGRRPAVLDGLAANGVLLRTWHRAGRLERALYKSGLRTGPRLDASVLLVNMASAHDLVTAVAPRAIVRRAQREGLPYVLAPHSLIERRLPARNRALLRELYGSAAALVVPSMSLRDDLERQLALRLPDAVEAATSTPLLDAPPLPWPVSGELRLACVARLDVEQKGHDALLAALATVSWRDERWTLDLYGSGPDETYIRSLVAFYGLADRVRLHGHVNGVKTVWQDHHALILPSRREARGIAITEAMAAGRPVLGTAIGGIPDSVIDGVTGILAEAPTVRALGASLERLWAQRAALPQWGREARARVEGLFAIDPVDRLVQVLISTERR